MEEKEIKISSEGLESIKRRGNCIILEYKSEVVCQDAYYNKWKEIMKLIREMKILKQ